MNDIIGRRPATHELKTWPDLFEDVVSGKKRFDVRRNDRTPKFTVGDELLLREYIPPSDHSEGSYTGKVARFRVLYILDLGRVAYRSGFVVMTIEPINAMRIPEVLTCVYCGKQYPAGTPTHGADVQLLTDHIKACPKHPMRKAEEDVKKLRSALGGFLETEDAQELSLMEIAIRGSDAPDVDKAVAINAIQVMLDTNDET